MVVPGRDGRAGMAAITLKDQSASLTELTQGLAKRCTKSLPHYAVPVFLRILPEYGCPGAGVCVMWSLEG